MKKSLLVLVGILLLVILTACGTNTLEKNEVKDEPGTEVVSDNVANEKQENNEPTEEPKEPQSESNSPHQFSGFTKDEKFTGGVEAKDYNLNGVRRGPHPTFTRLIFDFTVGPKGNESAQEPPKYQISYSDEENKVTLVFEGVKYNFLANKVQEMKEMAPIIGDVEFTSEKGKLIVNLNLNEKVSYQVFPLSSPARIAIVMSPDKIQ